MNRQDFTNIHKRLIVIDQAKGQRCANERQVLPLFSWADKYFYGDNPLFLNWNPTKQVGYCWTLDEIRLRNYLEGTAAPGALATGNRWILIIFGAMVAQADLLVRVGPNQGHLHLFILALESCSSCREGLAKGGG